MSASPTSVRPGVRLIQGLWIWLALGLAASAWETLVGVWAGAGLALLGAGAVEALWLSWMRPPSAQRRLPGVMSLGGWHEVRVRLDHPVGGRLRGAFFDHLPPEFEHEHLPQDFQLKGGGWAELGYRVRPTERGTYRFTGVDLILDGPLGLLRKRVLVPAEDEVRVYPDFRAVSRYALLALDDRQSQMGIHVRRRRGEGTDFFQLREYREGDSMRQIDWKATSRRLQLISREYRDEEDQTITFLLDCGRRMHARDGELAHFDHVLNAILLLGYVALRQGDAVGLQAFSGQDRWVPPRKGVTAMSTLINGVFDLSSSTAASDYAEAARRLAARQRRRSLVILLTNLRDEDDTDLRAALTMLRTRHLVLVASLREPVLDAARDAEVETFQDALKVASVEHYLHARRLSFERLRSLGIQTLDVQPAALPVALVNRYLEIKRARLL
ncbi:MAG: DUF58 domain-containing protein [Alphaproteobacteria bacterium]|nr:DUF58 domain-containing protein [Alphaproteobacteria bacterium]